jgi:hypothetical protein
MKCSMNFMTLSNTSRSIITVIYGTVAYSINNFIIRWDQ